ncbi:hypothetical protein DF185_21575 [Marinifilum breve]|uniref:DUF3667 domain-containing protein n=1 Tax=Marinifilum breve TaxID=2184082 RepID=A0A2V3ZRM9_9BACT|nr:DUF3667 domain-containing protein [Marinifilum breve]PXX95690.1 hypothetical protein DF185_21575 [Marinifilum breve]
MKQRIKKYLRKLPKKRVQHFEGFCPNCEFPVNGKFCSNCGQSTKSFQRPFWTVVSESVGDALSVDNRLIHTLIPLFLKPGYLTREFMRGRRARYTPPFRLYLFLTFFAFLLLAYNHKPESAAAKELAVETDDGKKLDMVSFLEEIVKDDEFDPDNLKLDSLVESNENTTGIKINLNPKNVAKDSLTENERDEESLIQDNDIKKLIEMWKLNPSLMMDNAFKKLSQTLLIILPLFALTLAFVYIRRKYYMLEHLLISLNFHAYIFVLVIISELLLMVNIEFISTLALYLYFLIPIQLFLTMKFYYKQSWVKTFFKFVFVSFIYNILLFTGIIMSLVAMVA